MTVLCRFCRAPLGTSFADLGATPLANAYLADDPAAIAAERSFPLHVMACEVCKLVQTTETVPAGEIFAHDYAYLSSYSQSWVEHAGRYAEAMTARFGLGSQSKVVEIASNDGYLLQHFVKRGIPVLGVEPAGHAAELAIARGVPSVVEFFGAAVATALREQGHAADLMAANNVLAHVPDIRDFVAGFAVLLKPRGLITFEFPHLLNLIRKVQFDTIYHEHYSYLSLLAVETILASAGLVVFDVEELPTHGGSLRVFAGHRDAGHAVGAGLAKVRADEAAAGLGDMAAYSAFNDKVRAVVAAFRDFLARARAEGRRVAGYGAAAKGNTFLNVAGVGRDQIDFVVDRNPEKQGRLLPGSHIPVRSPEALDAEKPDYVVILPWNLADEIRREHARIAGWGGRFVTAVPVVQVY